MFKKLAAVIAFMAVVAMLMVVGTPTAAHAETKNRSPHWLSGAAGIEAANGSFGRWRGSKVEIAQFWVDDPALYPIGPRIAGCSDCGMWRNFRGPVSISIAPRVWRGWQAEAAGTNDAYWKAIAKKARQLRKGKGTVYLNPYYEFNGDWMRWSVTRNTAGMRDFRRAWARTSAIMNKEFPSAKIVLNAAASRDVPRAMWPRRSSFDTVGVDIYNEWPHCVTAASCKQIVASRIDPLRRAAATRGKNVALPEWGNAARSVGGGGGESPAFISAVYAYLLKHDGRGRGKIVYETYFNIGGYDQRFELYPSTVQPRTAARYRAKF